MTINDIARETNLRIREINKSIDWLIMNNFATEEKGRNGKVYILTNEGKTTFSQLIDRYLKN